MSKNGNGGMSAAFEAPKEINIVEFIESRSREMDAMLRASSTVVGNTAVQQQLPRHMRRRAASHNVKRLPLRLRPQAQKEMAKSGAAVITKRPSRRYRRRPSNLLQAYERRKRRHVWLETHIWHAKRFHMAELWGYKIPMHRNDRGVRAAYRDSVRQCLLIDLSYYSCIQVTGPQEFILSRLSRLTDPSAGPTFASRSCINGSREGQTMLYHDSCYPWSAIGEVTFLWRADLSESRSERQLWIWAHPSCCQLVLDELKKVFDIAQSDESMDCDQSESKVVELKIMKDELCRYKLIGPMSQQVMTQSLITSDFNLDEQKDDILSTKIVNDRSLFEAIDKQKASWNVMKSLTSPTDLPPHSVHGLVVEDPRLNLPQKKTIPDMTTFVKELDVVPQLDHGLVSSPIWDKHIRDDVTNSKLTTCQLNQLKSQILVPGSSTGVSKSRIPIILIQNPGVRSSNSGSGGSTTPGLGCGWDVIIPAGWGMSFWVAFVYRGARAIGLKELRHLTFETGQLLYPDHFPDTPPGEEMNLSMYRERFGKYGRMPPAKRCNYTKMGVVAPFHFPWKELVDHWVKQVSSNATEMLTDTNQNCGFFCIRDRKYLSELQQKLFPENSRRSSSVAIKVRRRKQSQKSVHDEASTKTVVEKNALQLSAKCLPCLVPVRIVLSGRGAPGCTSMICLANEDDLDSSDIRETKHKDPNKPAIKKNKKKSSEITNQDSDNSEIDSKPSKRNLKTDVDMSKLPTVENVVHNCSRQTIGYVTSGGFSFATGQGVGLGFVSLQGLLAVISQKPKMSSCVATVLVRSTRSLQYRFAKISVIVE